MLRPALNLTRGALIGLALSASMGAGARAQAPAPPAVTPETRAAFEAVIRDYLLRNPEVLQEALTELDRRQRVAETEARKGAIEQNRTAIYNSPNQFVWGNPNGDVTLVEFMDYNCGFCKKSLTEIQEVLKTDPKLRLVIKDFPILGPASVEASKIALAAKKQLSGERYWAYHVKLMGQRGPVDRAKAVEAAREAGADPARLARDAEAPDVGAALREVALLGDAIGITGTPAFVLGDELISGAVGVEAMREAIGNVRKCGRPNC